MKEENSGAVVCRSAVFALIWRCVTAALCLAGLYPLLFGGAFKAQNLCYFTVQSNLLIAALLLILAGGTARQLLRGERGAPFGLRPAIQLGIVFYIQITFLVFALVLSGSMFSMGAGIGFSNLLLHYVVPLMALADWLLFGAHGLVGIKTAALWLCYPAAYVIFSFIRAPLGKPFFGGARYPYFFMDADLLGWNLLWVAPLFFAGFFLLGALLTTLDSAIAKRVRARSSR